MQCHCPCTGADPGTWRPVAAEQFALKLHSRRLLSYFPRHVHTSALTPPPCCSLSQARPSPSPLYPLAYPSALSLPPFAPLSPYGLMANGMMGNGMMGPSLAAFGHGPDMAGPSRTDAGHEASPLWDTSLRPPTRPATDTQPGRRGGASNRPAPVRVPE